VLFDDVWERPGLCKRDRSLITCAVPVALNRTEQLERRAPSTTVLRRRRSESWSPNQGGLSRLARPPL